MPKGIPGSTPICSVASCSRPTHGYGYCQLHVRRWQKHGDPNYIKPRVSTCAIDGCGKKHRCQGLCDMHYTRLRRHGDPLTAYVIHGDDEARFWQYINRTETCWLWTGTSAGNGYGHFYLTAERGQGRKTPAHRFAYELLVGPIPEGLELDHLCRVPVCCNPLHLEPVTHAENVRRGARYRKRKEQAAVDLITDPRKVNR